MKIRSFNVRGLGSLVKKEEVYSFYTKNDLNFCCLQEIKMENFSERDGIGIWKSEGLSWGAEGSIGRSGGLLSFWDERVFECSSRWSLEGGL